MMPIFQIGFALFFSCTLGAIRLFAAADDEEPPLPGAVIELPTQRPIDYHQLIAHLRSGASTRPASLERDALLTSLDKLLRNTALLDAESYAQVRSRYQALLSQTVPILPLAQSSEIATSVADSHLRQRARLLEELLAKLIRSTREVIAQRRLHPRTFSDGHGRLGAVEIDIPWFPWNLSAQTEQALENAAIAALHTLADLELRNKAQLAEAHALSSAEHLAKLTTWWKLAKDEVLALHTAMDFALSAPMLATEISELRDAAKQQVEALYTQKIGTSGQLLGDGGELGIDSARLAAIKQEVLTAIDNAANPSLDSSCKDRNTASSLLTRTEFIAAIKTAMTAYVTQMNSLLTASKGRGAWLAFGNEMFKRLRKEVSSQQKYSVEDLQDRLNLIQKLQRQFWQQLDDFLAARGGRTGEAFVATYEKEVHKQLAALSEKKLRQLEELQQQDELRNLLQHIHFEHQQLRHTVAMLLKKQIVGVSADTIATLLEYSSFEQEHSKIDNSWHELNYPQAKDALNALREQCHTRIAEAQLLMELGTSPAARIQEHRQLFLHELDSDLAALDESHPLQERLLALQQAPCATIDELLPFRRQYMQCKAEIEMVKAQKLARQKQLEAVEKAYKAQVRLLDTISMLLARFPDDQTTRSKIEELQRDIEISRSAALAPLHLNCLPGLDWQDNMRTKIAALFWHAQGTLTYGKFADDEKMFDFLRTALAIAQDLKPTDETRRTIGGSLMWSRDVALGLGLLLDSALIHFRDQGRYPTQHAALLELTRGLNECFEAGTVLARALPGRKDPAAMHGIKNLGYTCYLNVIFNALAWNSPLLDLLDSRVPLAPDAGTLRRKLIRAIPLLRQNKHIFVIGSGEYARQLVGAVADWKSKPLDSLNHYEDCSEFLGDMLVSLAGSGNALCVNHFYEVIANQTGMISTIRASSDPIISVEISEQASNLQERLDARLAPSQHLAKGTQGQMVISSPAELLIIALKRGAFLRFNEGSTGRSLTYKRKTRIALSPQLRLSARDQDGMHAISENTPWAQLKEVREHTHRYRLSGAIVHLGLSTTSGHYVYVSFPRNREEQILFHNDEKIYPIDGFVPERVVGSAASDGPGSENIDWNLELIERNAVLAFYERIID